MDGDASTNTTANGSDESTTHTERSETRTYVRVQPTTDAVDPTVVSTHLERCHGLAAGTTPDDGWFDTATPPTIEILLATEGEHGGEVAYYVGIDEEHAIDPLEPLLRGLFPDSYEFTRTNLQLDDAFDGTTPTTSDADPPEDTDAATTPENENKNGNGNAVAAVEYHGRGERRDDWQTRLTPYRELETHPEADTRRPLSAVVEVMATADASMVYQALLRPKPDWTAAAETRRRDLRAGRDTHSQRLVAYLLGDAVGTSDMAATGTDTGAATGSARPHAPADAHAHTQRLEELDRVDTRHSFDLNVRAAAVATGASATHDDAVDAVEALTSAFGEVGHTCYEIAPRTRTGTEGRTVLERISSRRRSGISAGIRATRGHLRRDADHVHAHVDR